MRESNKLLFVPPIWVPKWNEGNLKDNILIIAYKKSRKIGSRIWKMLFDFLYLNFIKNAEYKENNPWNYPKPLNRSPELRIRVSPKNFPFYITPKKGYKNVSPPGQSLFHAFFLHCNIIIHKMRIFMLIISQNQKIVNFLKEHKTSA